MVHVYILETGPRLNVSSDRLVKRGIEPEGKVRTCISTNAIQK